MKKINVLTLAAACAAIAVPAFAEGTEGGNRPKGFRFLDGDLALLPYVNLAFTYDSNVDATKKATSDTICYVTPGLGLEYNDNNGFTAAAKIYYSYRHYFKHQRATQDTYGEGLRLKKTLGEENGKGWTFMFDEEYRFIGQDDDINRSDGRGMWRDRETVDVHGLIQRRFSDRLNAALTASYGRMEYANDAKKYATLYGWQRYSVGGEVGIGVGSYTDFIVSGGYSKYRHGKSRVEGRTFSNSSEGYSIMAGLGSRATKQITYRALVGASWFEYANKYDDHGWTYQLSARWKITDRWSATLLGSSYYQPSETYTSGATKVYSLSAGLKYRVTEDFSLGADIAYRMDDRVYTVRSMRDRDANYCCGRIRADWYFNRYASIYAAAEYEWVDYSSSNDWSYDRLRGTCGIQLHY